MTPSPSGQVERDTGAGLDPELAVYMAALSARVIAIAGSDPGLELMRRAGREARLAAGRSGPAMRAEEMDLGGIPARAYRPADARGVILYLHGGGWVMLDIDTHDHILRSLAMASGCTVIGLDYPRAPEVRFPDLHALCSASLDAVRARAGDIGPGAEAPILAGDSSGANLAMATAIANGGPVSGLILFYGVYDAEFGRLSYTRFGAAPYILSADRMKMFWDYYCPEVLRRDPLAVPFRQDVSVLAKLPPTWIAMAGRDVLIDENEAMLARLREAGVELRAIIEPDAPHGFVEAIGQSRVASRVLDDAARWAKGLYAAR